MMAAVCSAPNSASSPLSSPAKQRTKEEAYYRVGVPREDRVRIMTSSPRADYRVSSGRVLPIRSIQLEGLAAPSHVLWLRGRGKAGGKGSLSLVLGQIGLILTQIGKEALAPRMRADWMRAQA